MDFFFSTNGPLKPTFLESKKYSSDLVLPHELPPQEKVNNSEFKYETRFICLESDVAYHTLTREKTSIHGKSGRSKVLNSEILLFFFLLRDSEILLILC